MGISKNIDKETNSKHLLSWVNTLFLWITRFIRRYFIYLVVVFFNIAWVLATIEQHYHLPELAKRWGSCVVSWILPDNSAQSSSSTACSIVSPLVANTYHHASPAQDINTGLIRLYLGSGVPDGYYFDVGRRIAQWLSLHQSDEPACANGGACNIQVSDLSSRGSIDNVNCALKGKVHLFISQTDIVQTSLDRQTDACQINPKPLMCVYTEVVTVIARVDMRAETIEDLQGLEICLPIEGSGSHDNARKILEALDVKFRDTRPEGMHYSECMLAVEDGRFDAMIYTIKHPHEPLLRYSQETSKPLRFLSIPPTIPEAEEFKLRPCHDAIDISQYPQIAHWMEPENLKRGAKPVSSYCTRAALFHTNCVDMGVLEVLKHRLSQDKYRHLIPSHLYEPRLVKNMVTGQCERL